jgi:hypothetical protein
LSFQIRNLGWDAGGLNVVTTGCEVILNEVYFGLDKCKLIAEVAESVVITAITLDFGRGVPIVEIHDGVAESVVGGGWAVEQCIEPTWQWLGGIVG